MDENTADVIKSCVLGAIILIATMTAVIVTKDPKHFGWLALLIFVFV